MSLRFEEYEARRIVNVHRHVDGAWFWDKYTAHPYVGCRSGCSFCYERGGPYLGGRDPDQFDRVIRVKTNAAALLRRELGRLPRDVIVCGDWQEPAEGRYRLSRAMLEVVCELGFPLLVIERSPLVARDLDLLEEIGRRSWVAVLFSASNLDPALKHAFEPRSPGVRQRFRAMEAIAARGILAGTSLMPILPDVADDERHLDEVVRATRDHGGQVVLAGGLTLDGAQARLTLAAARALDPDLAERWSRPRDDSAKVGRLVRALCRRHGLRDRLPRWIAPGPKELDKRIAEKLFLRAYDLEIEQAQAYRVWAYRKAARAVDEHPESVVTFDATGAPRLRDLPGVGTALSRRIEEWLQSEVSAKAPPVPPLCRSSAR